MDKKGMLVAFFVGASLKAGFSVADLFSSSHSCSKPFKPFEFTSEWQADNFYGDVQEYKECISDFVEEQNEAAEAH